MVGIATQQVAELQYIIHLKKVWVRGSAGTNVGSTQAEFKINTRSH